MHLSNYFIAIPLKSEATQGNGTKIMQHDPFGRGSHHLGTFLDHSSKAYLLIKLNASIFPGKLCVCCTTVIRIRGTGSLFIWAGLNTKAWPLLDMRDSMAFFTNVEILTLLSWLNPSISYLPIFLLGRDRYLNGFNSKCIGKIPAIHL